MQLQGKKLTRSAAIPGHPMALMRCKIPGSISSVTSCLVKTLTSWCSTTPPRR
jgi:hypothetical protein